MPGNSGDAPLLRDEHHAEHHDVESFALCAFRFYDGTLCVAVFSQPVDDRQAMVNVDVRRCTYVYCRMRQSCTPCRLVSANGPLPVCRNDFTQSNMCSQRSTLSYLYGVPKNCTPIFLTLMVLITINRLGDKAVVLLVF